MSKSQTKRKPANPISTSSSSSSRSRSSTTRVTARGRPTGSFGARRITQDEPEFFEVEGDALVVVEDGWTLGDEDGTEPELEGSTFAIRSDTAIVGVCLAVGLVVGAFLLGRTSNDKDAKTSARPAANAPGLPSAAIGAPSATTVPASQPRTIPTAVVGAFTPGAASAPQASTPAQPAAQPAATPETPATEVAEGKYVLVVCTTTPGNAAKVAQWLNTDARSPIFGRADLQAYTTRKGVVRIRGFEARDQDVFRQVKATNDPLGGRGTFHSAYFKRS